MSICKIVFFILCLVFLGLSTGETYASPSPSGFKEEVKRVIKKLSVPLTDPVSKNDIPKIQASLNKIISDAEKEGKPIHFGIGVLDKEGLAVAGRYVAGTFKTDDFSKYNYVVKAFKQKKIIQDRLYLQDRSELLIVCVPLIQQKEVMGAFVLGFNPSELKKNYNLTTEQFMALDFNK